MPFQVGQRLGDYEVQEMLGVGGMGHVYRVRNIISNRTEAMKVLLPDLTAEPDLATRFIAEIRTLASFDHPNIAQLHTALIAENQLIMMMEFVEGYTLEQLAKQRAMPIPEVAGYISQALSALGYAHSRGIVHRDVKPANLMVTSHGIVKLMDFGIAKSKVENNNYTRPGTTMGSLYYMSPEQVRGDTVDARSDIYSMGIVLYEMLAGRRPFESETTFTILNKQLNEQPQPPIEVNPAIPEGLNAIILIALAKDPAQRFQSADAFRNALKSFCAAPSGQEAAAAVGAAAAVAAMAAPTAASSAAPGSATSVLSSPAPVAPASVPAAAYAAPPASTPLAQPMQAPVVASPAPVYAQSAVRQEAPAQASARPPRSNKALWIATGAIAAVLALVAVGIAVPHWMKTHAAGSANTSDASSTAPAIQPAAPITPSDASPAPAPAAQPAPMTMQPAPAVGAAAPASRQASKPSAAVAPESPAAAAPVSAPAPIVVAAPQPPAGPSPQEIQLVQDRLTDVNARASTARRQVQQIRSQQEQMGLGLRGDVESAESRLDTYLRAANSDLQRGNVTAATQDLNKAEPELNTLERFLGH
jgi:serine/threonine-protein kinase